MTHCTKLFEALDKRLEEKKTLEQIGWELCDTVDDPRGKAIRLISFHKGYEYLTQNAEWLGYTLPHNPAGINEPKKFASEAEAKEELKRKIEEARKKYEAELEKRRTKPLKCKAKLLEFCPKDKIICGHWSALDAICSLTLKDDECNDGCSCSFTPSYIKDWDNRDDKPHCPHCGKEVRIEDYTTVVKPFTYCVYQLLTGIIIGWGNEENRALADKILQAGKGHYALKEMWKQ